MSLGVDGFAAEPASGATPPCSTRPRLRHRAGLRPEPEREPGGGSATISLACFGTFGTADAGPLSNQRRNEKPEMSDNDFAHTDTETGQTQERRTVLRQALAGGGAAAAIFSQPALTAAGLVPQFAQAGTGGPTCTPVLSGTAIADFDAGGFIVPNQVVTYTVSDNGDGTCTATLTYAGDPLFAGLTATIDFVLFDGSTISGVLLGTGSSVTNTIPCPPVGVPTVLVVSAVGTAGNGFVFDLNIIDQGPITVC